MHVLVLAGTRPEAIKVAPVVMALREESGVRTTLCSTGQHREMLIQAFADFGLVPDRSLDIMQQGQTLASLSSRLFASVDPVLEELAPDWVLVQGDTTTVMVSSMCAFYRHIRVGHIEAGLRSFRKGAPFPEEINRRVAAVVADLHFAPTATAKGNLLREGVPEAAVVVTGNTVIDALLWMRERIRRDVDLLPPLVRNAREAGKRLVLITGHRRESFGEGFASICRAIRALADAHTDTLFVYPVHLNPQVRKPVGEILSGHERILLLEPLSYKHFIALMDAAHLVLTDSGGIQEEAPALGKPVLVMRDVTERPEGVSAGTAKLVGRELKAIIDNVGNLLTSKEAYAAMANAVNPYGDGLATQRICQALHDARSF